ncbi:unnamed protein product [Amaranthus hypochondriacus]
MHQLFQIEHSGEIGLQITSVKISYPRSYTLSSWCHHQIPCIYHGVKDGTNKTRSGKFHFIGNLANTL